MKKILIGSVLALSTSAFAGYYTGIQSGVVYDGLNASNNAFPNVTLKEKDNRFAGRVFIGDEFNKYFAIETGYLLATNATIHSINDGATIHVKEQLVDVAMKGSFYMGNNFSIYGKVGAAYMHTKTDGKGTYSIDPFFGAGLSYNINKNFTIDASWNRYAGNSNSAQDIVYGSYKPSLDFYGLGVTYKFN